MRDAAAGQHARPLRRWARRWVELHRWFEPSERNPPIGDDPFGLGRVHDSGADDSWRVNVGEQGFGNGFQIEIPLMVGLAIREVVALVDVRTERA